MTGRDRGQGALPGIGPDDPAAAVARVRRYVDRQLRAARAMDALTPTDDGLVGLAMTLADLIDAEVTRADRSAFTIARVAAELRPLLMDLRGDRRDAAGDADFDAELARLEAAVRDAARYRPADVGPGDAGPSDPPAP